MTLVQALSFWKPITKCPISFFFFVGKSIMNMRTKSPPHSGLSKISDTLLMSTLSSIVYVYDVVAASTYNFCTSSTDAI